MGHLDTSLHSHSGAVHFQIYRNETGTEVCSSTSKMESTGRSESWAGLSTYRITRPYLNCLKRLCQVCFFVLFHPHHLLTVNPLRCQCYPKFQHIPSVCDVKLVPDSLAAACGPICLAWVTSTLFLPLLAFCYQQFHIHT